jgi:hypothetical protein
MPNDPFTIRIFVPDGDPEGVRIIDRMNWTGHGITFPRDKWPTTKLRPEFSRAGVYILVGYREEGDELPTVYIGEGDVVRNRIDSHFQSKDFWSRAIVFTASNDSLNKAHVKWLEHALVNRAAEVKQCNLDNVTEPQEPGLNEGERSDVQRFLREILQILPLVGLRALEIRKAVAEPAREALAQPVSSNDVDTVIVPAKPENFEKVFLGENCWHAIHIAGAMLQKIKYIAAYQSYPEMKITHYAAVASIEPYGEQGKYKLIFSGQAKPIGPIPFGDAPQGAMTNKRYTTLEKLMRAKKLTDLA